MKTCPRCNSNMDDNASFCSNCGFAFNKKSIMPKIVIITVVAAAVVVSIVVGRFAYNVSKANSYLQSLKECADLMMDGIDTAQDIYDDIVAALDKLPKDDLNNLYDKFKDVLNKLSEDESFKIDLDKVKDSLDEVAKIIGNTQDPPEG